MANVVAQVAGGEMKEHAADDVCSLRNKLGLTKEYTATINGTPANSDDELNDHDVVRFAKAVRGGRL